MAESIFLMSLLLVLLLGCTLAVRFGVRLAQGASPSLLQAAAVVTLAALLIAGAAAGCLWLVRWVWAPWYVVALAIAATVPAAAVLALRLVLFRSRRELLRGLGVLALGAGLGSIYAAVALSFATD